MIFWKDLFIPVLILSLVVWLIVILINIFFRAIHFDVVILKIISFFVIWYFVGPIIYTYLVDHIIVNEQEVLKILYMPIQYITGSLSKLV